MTRATMMGLAAIAALSGCSKPQAMVARDFSVVDVQEMAPPPGEVQAPGIAYTPDQPSNAIKVSIPQIAYSYNYGFELPAAAVGTTLDRHVALCDKLGLLRCRVLHMERRIKEDAASASLKIVVEAKIARSFGATLTKAAAAAGGTQSEISIEAEDLSKQIVDTEARLRSKQLLAGRLMELLRTRKGPVADLVAAERGVADVQQEIDAAQSWLAEARGRVAMSTLNLNYWSPAAAAEMHGAPDTLGSSIGAMGSSFTRSLGLLLLFVAGGLPWAVLLGGLIFGLVKLVQRLRRAKKRTPPEPVAPE